MTGHPLDGIDPVAFGTALSQLPPTHELVAAARAAVDLADARHDDQRALADAASGAGAQCRGLAMAHTMTRAALSARADIDGPGRLEKFDAPSERDSVPPASDPAATAAAVMAAREWADAHADALEARQAELAQWHSDQACADTTAVPEQATAPAMERLR